MAVQAQAVDVPKARKIRWAVVVGPLLLLALGAIFILLGAYSTEPDATSTFTDEVLGNLFSLPSQATLYAVGALCFFVAGLQLFRRLDTIRSVLNWLLIFSAAFAFLVWVTSGGSMNLPGMFQATLTAATPLTLAGELAGAD